MKLVRQAVAEVEEGGRAPLLFWTSRLGSAVSTTSFYATTYLCVRYFECSLLVEELEDETDRGEYPEGIDDGDAENRLGRREVI